MALIAVTNIAIYNNWTVGIPGYVIRFTESLLPVRHADRSKKNKGIIAQSEVIEAELSRKDKDRKSR